MSLSAVRLGDICSGHGCYPPRPNLTASNDVFINGLGAHRVGDSWQEHCCKSCHGGTTISGSTDVFINGLPLARIGDQVDCGSVCLQGSTDVFSG